MISVTPADALLIVDVQNDFLPGGALAVPDGDSVIPVINRLAGLPFGSVVATQDWHPANHMSFVAQGGPWPAHCVAGTPGADLAAGLLTAPVGLVLRKGRAVDVDSYSAFSDNNTDQPATTGLAAWLRAVGVTRVFVTGLALDVCVTATACDAQRTGFDTFVVVDACRGIAPPEEATARLVEAGIPLVSSDTLA